MPHRPTVIGIAGCSGSGKTTLAPRARHATRRHALPARPLLPRPVAVPARRPREAQLRPPRLPRVRALHRPHPRPRPGPHHPAPGLRLRHALARRQHLDPIVPTGYVLVEGILALHYPELPPLYDFSIYVDAPNEVCLNRRIYRDMRERGRTEQSVRDQFDATAKPMADLYVLPSQTRATMTVAGTESLDWSIEQILHQLHAHKLL